MTVLTAAEMVLSSVQAFPAGGHPHAPGSLR